MEVRIFLTKNGEAKKRAASVLQDLKNENSKDDTFLKNMNKKIKDLSLIFLNALISKLTKTFILSHFLSIYWINKLQFNPFTIWLNYLEMNRLSLLIVEHYVYYMKNSGHIVKNIK